MSAPTRPFSAPTASPTPAPRPDAIPVETVPLPSRGRVYPESSPLHGCEAVSIAPMTANEENILMSRALLKSGTAVTKLLNALIVEPAGVDARDMVAGDRNAVLFAIRISAYGREYPASVQCTDCGAKRDDHVFDLATFPLKTLDVEPIAPGVNRFEFTLPASKRVVHFALATGRTEEERHRNREARKKALGAAAANSEATITDALRDAIVAVDGQEDRTKIADFAKRMLARDSLELRRYMNRVSPDIVTKQTYVCAECGETQEVEMPMEASFLWPHSRESA